MDYFYVSIIGRLGNQLFEFNPKQNRTNQYKKYWKLESWKKIWKNLRLSFEWFITWSRSNVCDLWSGSSITMWSTTWPLNWSVICNLKSIRIPPRINFSGSFFNLNSNKSTKISPVWNFCELGSLNFLICDPSSRPCDQCSRSFIPTWFMILICHLDQNFDDPWQWCQLLISRSLNTKTLNMSS